MNNYSSVPVTGTNKTDEKTLNDTRLHIYNSAKKIINAGYRNKCEAILPFIDEVKHWTTTESSIDNVKHIRNLYLCLLNTIILYYVPKEWNVNIVDTNDAILSVINYNRLIVPLDFNKIGYTSLLCDFSNWSFTLRKEISLSDYLKGGNNNGC